MDSWAVEASGLHKHFREVHAVRGLDLRVGRGEVFGLLGPNGAGKTTRPIDAWSFTSGNP